MTTKIATGISIDIYDQEERKRNKWVQKNISFNTRNLEDLKIAQQLLECIIETMEDIKSSNPEKNFFLAAEGTYTDEELKIYTQEEKPWGELEENNENN